MSDAGLRPLSPYEPPAVLVELPESLGAPESGAPAPRDRCQEILTSRLSGFPDTGGGSGVFDLAVVQLMGGLAGDVEGGADVGPGGALDAGVDHQSAALVQQSVE